ncbi:cytochrome b5 [Lojkania enalia]|uniref:Cytochrome b5 n=1 Tax=Lojkania enalia TaxID=147567 RepID=A0A9P4KGG3_9PLEO|nr:cytochrome b5 [Didymosphaeria enalia]
MSDGTEQPKTGKFRPKQPVDLPPSKDDVITREYLSKCNGENEGFPTYVAIKGTVFDVSRNEAYAVGKSYHVFAGKEPNYGLGTSKLAPEFAVPEDKERGLVLTESERKVLEDWYTFFKNRYAIVGRLEPESSVSL